MRTIVQLVLINDTGDSFYRMRWPGQDLVRRRSDWRFLNLAANAQERLPWALAADLLVLFQSQDFDLLPIIQERRKRGLKTLVEYNDNFYEPPAWSPVAQPWSSPLLWQSYETIMNTADGLMVTGPGLKELFAAKTQTPIHVVPNYFPRSLIPFEQTFTAPTDEIRIGWAGSLGHMADVLSLTPMLQRLVNEDSRVRIHLMGNDTLPALIGLPADRVRFTPWGSMDQYFEFWKPLHIGIAPLLNTGYNRCRSDIKAIEMSACGALPIVQKFLPYDEFLAAVDLPGFASLDELEEQLRGYLADPAQIERDVKRSYDYVENNRLEQIHSKRMELYESFFPDVSPLQFAELPATSGVAMPINAGYFELDGTAEIQTRSSAVIAQVQNLWNQQKRHEAMNLVLQAIHSNPLNPDWNIACAKCLSLIQHPTLADRIAHHRANFPRDLRISLIEIGSATDIEKRKALWIELFITLERDSAARGAFQSEILKIFVNDLKRFSGYLDLAIKLSKLYPNSPEIRLPLAELLERDGNFHDALIHFDWLNRAHDNFEQSKGFFQTADKGYTKAWSAALRARLHGRS